MSVSEQPVITIQEPRRKIYLVGGSEHFELHRQILREIADEAGVSDAVVAEFVQSPALPVPAGVKVFTEAEANCVVYLLSEPEQLPDFAGLLVKLVRNPERYIVFFDTNSFDDENYQVWVNRMVSVINTELVQARVFVSFIHLRRRLVEILRL